MHKRRLTTLLVLLSTLSAAPALAQQSSGGNQAPAAVTVGRLQKTADGWRSSRIVGATVYNDKNDDIGTVDDLLVGPDGKVTKAVISVGGFLGMGSKLVSVPYSQLQFQEQKPNRETAANATGGPPVAAGTATGVTPAPVPGSPVNTAPAGTASPAPEPNVTLTRIVLPGATKDSLNSMPSFSYGGA